MPARVETSLLVLEQVRDPAGTTWQPGDRAPLHHRAVRQAAMERPDLFVMEYATEPVDQGWLVELDKKYEAVRRGETRPRDGGGATPAGPPQRAEETGAARPARP